MGLQTNLTKMRAVNTRAQGHMAVREEKKRQENGNDWQGCQTSLKTCKNKKEKHQWW